MAPTLTDVAKRAKGPFPRHRGRSATRTGSDRRPCARFSRLRKNRLRATATATSRRVAVATTATVAVVVPDIANPVFGAFVKAAQAQGWHRAPDRGARRHRLRPRPGAGGDHAVAGRVDALVVCSPRLDAEDVLALCGDTPVVLVNRETTTAIAIVADADDGLRQTIDYLVALGHRHLAYVQGSAALVVEQHRVDLVADLRPSAVGLELSCSAGSRRPWRAAPPRPRA